MAPLSFALLALSIVEPKRAAKSPPAKRHLEAESGDKSPHSKAWRAL